MPRRPWIRRILGLVASLLLIGVMGGCGTSNQVTFTNVSDTWLNVRFFVASAHGSNQLVSRKKFQVKPGETAHFTIRRASSRGEAALVHLQVQPLTPSW